jgi:hypothetical protein
MNSGAACARNHWSGGLKSAEKRLEIIENDQNSLQN